MRKPPGSNRTCKPLLEDLRTRRLAGGSLAQVKMVARGLREQLELTQDLLTRGLGAIKEMETRLEARRQPLQATMATVSQTLEGAGNRLKKTLRSRVDQPPGPAFRPGGHRPGRVHPEFYPQLGPTGAAGSRPGLPARSSISYFRNSPRPWPTMSPPRSTSPWWNSSGSRKSGCARNWATCGSPCFWPSRKP